MGNTATDATGTFHYVTNSASLGLVTATIQLVGSDPVTANTAFAKASSVIKFGVIYGDQTNLTLFGVVNDLDPGGRTVHFSGVVNATVVTEANGKFNLATSATSLGVIDAVTTDLWGQPSDIAEVPLSSPTPVIISFGACNEAGTQWNFSGSISAPDPGGLLIYFGGLGGALAGETATVSDAGTFSISITLPQGTQGTLTLFTIDWWGQESNELWYPIA